jgi:hypothetical protein
LVTPIDAEAEPRVLRAEAHFVELAAGNRARIRNAAEAAGNARTGSFVAPHGGGVHEANRLDGHVADLQLQRGGARRGWLGFRRGCRLGRGLFGRRGSRRGQMIDQLLLSVDRLTKHFELFLLLGELRLQ